VALKLSKHLEKAESDDAYPHFKLDDLTSLNCELWFVMLVDVEHFTAYDQVGPRPRLRNKLSNASTVA
jgi:hypothetical protein